MQTGSDGLKLIKEFEGFEEVAYLDISGYPTIGYGQHIGVTRADVINKRKISEVEAERLLKKWLRLQVEPVINGLVRVELEQYEFDALASFVYNFGETKFRRSTLRAKLNKGDKAGAAEEFLRWNKSLNPKTGLLEEVWGLTRRRRAERSLFLNEERPQP